MDIKEILIKEIRRAESINAPLFSAESTYYIKGIKFALIAINKKEKEEPQRAPQRYKVQEITANDKTLYRVLDTKKHIITDEFTEHPTYNAYEMAHNTAYKKNKENAE